MYGHWGLGFEIWGGKVRIEGGREVMGKTYSVGKYEAVGRFEGRRQRWGGVWPGER